METWSIVVAAGSGQRFGGLKQYAELAGRPILEWSLAAARRACCRSVLVLPAQDVAAATWEADLIVAGGLTRSASVRAGLAMVPPDVEVVVVHDAARPLASPGIWRAVIEAVQDGADAAVPAVGLTDTVKQVHPDGSLHTLDRTALVAVQTPQAFRTSILRQVHAGGAHATDDAALVEAAGGVVKLVAGSRENIKVTDVSDLAIAAVLMGRSALGARTEVTR